VDRTGLRGGYNLSLHFARESWMSGGALLPPPTEFSDYPSVYTVIRKTGLILSAGKAPVDSFVIDKAHSEN
jgi:uncharacterized protein (TIGR03435 family)